MLLSFHGKSRSPLENEKRQENLEAFHLEILAGMEKLHGFYTMNIKASRNKNKSPHGLNPNKHKQKNVNHITEYINTIIS
jgi:hypothetical protein